MSPDLARGFPKTEQTWVSFASEANDILPKYDSYKVTSEEIDSDGGEIVFTGELVGKEKKSRLQGSHRARARRRKMEHPVFRCQGA